MDQWKGKSVSLSCGGLGFFQGVIDSVNLEDQSITLSRAFQNGIECKSAPVTISAADIKDIKILEEAAVQSASSNGTSTVAIKRRPRTQVVENLVKSSAPNDGGKDNKRSLSGPKVQAPAAPDQGSGALFRNVSPRKELSTTTPSTGNNTSAPASSRKDRGGTPGNRRDQLLRQRDNDCFGSDIDVAEMMREEFDFEKNLALFDKRLVFEEIEMEHNQPDLVRLVDCNRRSRRDPGNESASGNGNGGGAGSLARPAGVEDRAEKVGKRAPEPKYRNDENVLASLPAEYRPIKLNAAGNGNHRGDVVEAIEVNAAGRGSREYVTDSGLVVPAVDGRLRARIFAAAEARGVSSERVTELMGRSASELAVQLLGGSHRLNPSNSHQVPTVVALCGPGSRAAVYALAALRHLCSQGVRTAAFLPPLPLYPPDVEAELQLYTCCCSGDQGDQGFQHAVVHPTVDTLPASSVDAILLALDDHEMPERERGQAWHKQAIRWAEKVTGSNSPTMVVAIDPLAPPAGAELTVKASVVPGLPLWFPDEQRAGKVFMVNLAIPDQVYRDVGIAYKSPFGAKTMVNLHQAAAATKYQK